MQFSPKTAPLLTLATLSLLGLISTHSAKAQNYSYTTLDDPAATGFNFASGINDSNQVVGYYIDSLTQSSHGYLYGPSSGFSAIDAPLAKGNSTSATGINNIGRIVGSYSDTSGSHGFVKSPGAGFTTIDDPSATGGNTFAQSINNSGQVVGFYTDANYNTDPSSVQHGFLDTSTGFITLDDPNATLGTDAFGINSSGAVVGSYRDTTGTHGFLYTTADGFTTLDDPLAKGQTIAYGINDAGAVVGRYFDGTNLYGFVDNQGTFTTLSAPNAADGTSAFGINNSGTIVGYSVDNSIGTTNYVHGFEAAPAAVPEASTMVSFSLLLALGIGGAMIAAWRRKATTSASA